MLVGHVAVALLAKRVAPRLSLGTLMMAAILADLLWCVFLIAGVEHVSIRPGSGAVNYLDAADIAISHSLLMDLIWGAMLAIVYFLPRRYGREARLLFLAVVSHWLLDFVSHRPDMALAPGLHRYFGLGVWSSIPATIIIEGGLWLLAIVLYVHASHARQRIGSYVFWIGIVLLSVAWFNNIAGPPPASVLAAGIGSLIFFSLTVAWAYWIDRLRPLEIDGAAESQTVSA